MSLDEGSTVGIDDACASIVAAKVVVADAVDTYDVALVFDGTCTQECVPYVATRRGPVGNVDEAVVGRIGFVGSKGYVATEAWEAEVVAYLQTEAHPTPLYDDALCAGGVAALLTSIGEEMALVVVGDLTIGDDEVETVVVGSLLADGHGTCKGSMAFAGYATHPLQALIVGFGNILRGHDEARAPHLGKNDEMILLLPSFLLWSLLRQRRDRNGREQLFYCPVVGFYVCPAYVGLDEREGQIIKLTN